jgi:hypothetical protein
MASRKIPLGSPSPGVSGVNFQALVLVDNNINGFSLSLEDSASPIGYPSLEASITDTLLSAIQQDPRSGPVLLASVVANLALSTKQALFTVPTGRSAIVSDVILRSATVSLATAFVSLGFNAAANDVVANATHTGLTGPTPYKKLVIIAAGAVRGAAADVFGIIANTQQDPASVTVDVIGYYF